MDGLSRRDVELGTERMRSFLAAHQHAGSLPPTSSASAPAFAPINDRSFAQHHHLPSPSRLLLPSSGPIPSTSASNEGGPSVPRPPASPGPGPGPGTSTVSLPSISQLVSLAALPSPPGRQTQTYPVRPSPSPGQKQAQAQSPVKRRAQGHIVDPSSSTSTLARTAPSPAAAGVKASPGTSRAAARPSPVKPTAVAGRARAKPLLEAVLSSPAAASSSSIATPRARTRPTAAAAAPASSTTPHKARETSVGSDSSASSEFDILAPYFPRAPAPTASSPALAPAAVPVQAEAQQTPLRSSTSLPALLADLASSSSDDGEDDDEAFTPRAGEMRTPSGSASASLLDSVLTGGASADSSRRKWAASRRTGGGGGVPPSGGELYPPDHHHGYQPSRQPDARSPGGLYALGPRAPGGPLPRSQSFPHHLGLASSPGGVPGPSAAHALSQPLPSTSSLPPRSSMTPARAYHSSSAQPPPPPPTTATTVKAAHTLTDAYAAGPLDLSRSPGGPILTPYRPAIASSAVRTGASAGSPRALGPALVGSGTTRRFGHRREPSRAETECYWLSSPSESTQGADECERVGGSGAGSNESEGEDELSEADDDDDDDMRIVDVPRAHLLVGQGTIRSPPPASAFASAVPSGVPSSSSAPAHRSTPIQPLLFTPFASSSAAGPGGSHTAKPESPTTAGEHADDGRSTSSDKENADRARLAAAASASGTKADDVFGGEPARLALAGPSHAGAPPPPPPAVVVAGPPTTGGDKARSKKKKGLSGTPSLTSPVIQECDLPPVNIPSGPRSAAKPAFSYAAMIGQAILAHPRARLSLAEIYTWIAAAFPFYRKGEAGWMNSIRHNLSLNKCFVKVERDKPRDGAVAVVGKGMLWAIERGCEHQFEGGGFSKSGKPVPPKAKAAAASSGRSKSSTPVPSTTKSKKRKAGSAVLAEDESDRPSASPPAQQPQQPAKRLKLRVTVDSSPHVFGAPDDHDDYEADEGEARVRGPSPGGSSRADDSDASPEVGLLALPSLAAAFVPRDGPLYPTLPLPRAMLYGARPPPNAYEQSGDDGFDDYATPQRPLSRGPTGGGAAPSVPSSQEMPPPASCLRGLPHLTPSVSSPASSSPAQPFVPRPRAIQAHQALMRSSLGQLENITIVDDAGLSPDSASAAAAAAVPVGLQPGFQIAQAPSSPKAAGAHGAPPSPTTSRFHSALAPGIQSPMSSLRATAHDDEAAEPAMTAAAAVPHSWRPPTASAGGYGGYLYGQQGGHLSPLHNRKVSAGGTVHPHHQHHARGLSATGELMYHAMRDPPSAGATFKTPGMQPISASPRETLPRPWAFQMAGGPPSPGTRAGSGLSRRGMLLASSAVAASSATTPRGSGSSSSLAFSSAPYGGSSTSTPARTPASHHPTQSPAGAALLQRRAELGMLGAELTYGDDDGLSGTPGGAARRASVTALSGDPYDSGSAVEHELRHIGSKVAESPGGPAGWGGGGRTVATPGRAIAAGWNDEPEPSPGFSPGRPRYVFR